MIYRIILGLSALFLFGNFQCGDPECETSFLLRDWQPALLDNSGSEPLLASGPIPRKAFGIQLTARLSSDGIDTLRISNMEECYLSSIQPIKQIQLSTLNGFDTLSPGQDISQRFRMRIDRNTYFDYLPLDSRNLYLYNLADGTNGKYPIDLLMIDPPSLPGTYQFQVKIQFDSLDLDLNHDTIFTLPTIELQ